MEALLMPNLILIMVEFLVLMGPMITFNIQPADSQLEIVHTLVCRGFIQETIKAVCFLGVVLRRIKLVYMVLDQPMETFALPLIHMILILVLLFPRINGPL